MSYWAECLTDRATLLASGSPCTVWVPTKSIAQRWVQPGFKDTTWTKAATGIGMEQESGYRPLFGRNGDLGRKLYGKATKAQHRLGW